MRAESLVAWAAVSLALGWGAAPPAAGGAIRTQVSQTDGAVLVYVPAGAFVMGSDAGEKNERPTRRVQLSAYWIDRTEVTASSFARLGSRSFPQEYLRPSPPRAARSHSASVGSRLPAQRQ